MPYLMGCLSTDGAFWRLGSDNGAERYNGAGRWAREANLPLTELSVGSMTNAWGVDTSGNAVQLTPGPVTRIAAPAAREVAVSRDDDLWMLNWDDNNKPYHRKPDGSWERAGDTLCWKIAVGDPGDVWVLMESWFWGNPWQLSATGWVKRGDQQSTAIAVGQDGAAWTNAGGPELDLLERDASGAWSVVSAPTDYAVACIAASEDWVAGDDAWQRTGADWTLHPAPPVVAFDGIAAAADGTVIAWQGEWSKAGRSFRFNGTGGWEPLPLSPENGFFNAAVRDAHGVYFALWDDHQLMYWPGTAWQDAGRKVRRVAACPDGSVWALDAGGTASRRTADGTWQALPAELWAIGAGGWDIAWGVDPMGAPLRWDGQAFAPFASNLTQRLTDISAAADGTVCAIAADKSLLYLDGTAWKPLQPGQAFLRVQAAGADRICAVTTINLDTGTNYVWTGALPSAAPAATEYASDTKPEAQPRPRRREPPKAELRAWMAQGADAAG